MALALLVTAYAPLTRSGSLGPLPHGESLVTLVVTEDRAAIRRECLPFFVDPALLGCQTSLPVALPEGRVVRVVKVVRYTDRLPSQLAFEIDLHELCHAIAALQPIDDPCHVGNGGIVEGASFPQHRRVR